MITVTVKPSKAFDLDYVITVFMCNLEKLTFTSIFTVSSTKMKGKKLLLIYIFLIITFDKTFIPMTALCLKLQKFLP